MKTYFTLILSSLTFLFIFGFDKFVFGTYTYSLAKSEPIFSNVYLFRSLIIFISSLLFVHSVKSANFSPTKLRETKPTLTPILIKWPILSLSVFFLMLFILRAEVFSRICEENGIIEISSALFLFLSCGCFLLLSFRFYKMKLEYKSAYLTISLFFAIIFFIIGMEEISWSQSFLHFETPLLFKSNRQHEMNLHNYATGAFENIYYFSTFLFLIVVPFINDQTPLFSKSKYISFFIPGRLIIFVSAINVVFNYDMWNNLATQLSFFITLLILIYYIYLSFKETINQYFSRHYLLVLTSTYVLTQVAFWVWGNKLLTTADATEYKEFFIPLAFVVYSLEVIMKQRKLKLGYFEKQG